MKRKSIFLTFGLLVLSWIGCVENDLPYPTIVGQITEMEVAGMTSCRILGASNTVEIKVADTIDLRDLRVEKLVVTEGMKVYPDSAGLSPGGNPSLFQCPSAAGVAGGDWRGL